MGGAEVIHRQNKNIDLFNEHGAVDAGHAVAISEIGVRNSYIFRRMVGRGVFINCGDGRYYIDNNVVPLFKSNRRRRALIGLELSLYPFIVTPVKYLLSI
jgi:hypothetical protein